MDRFEKIVEIAVPVEIVFRVLSDYEDYPRWMHNITAVRRIESNRTEWRGVAPHDGHTELHWTTEITVFEPDRRIVWHTIEGDISTDCEVVLQETKRATTLVRMVRGFEIKEEDTRNANRASLIEYQQLRFEEDLARLKQLAESVHQQQHRKVADAARAANAEDARQTDTSGTLSEAEKVLRRGVDRLLDEPPSREWRK